MECFPGASGPDEILEVAYDCFRLFVERSDAALFIPQQGLSGRRAQPVLDLVIIHRGEVVLSLLQEGAVPLRFWPELRVVGVDESAPTDSSCPGDVQ